MPRRFNTVTGAKFFAYHERESASLLKAVEILLEAADCKVEGAEAAAKAVTGVMAKIKPSGPASQQ